MTFDCRCDVVGGNQKLLLYQDHYSLHPTPPYQPCIVPKAKEQRFEGGRLCTACLERHGATSNKQLPQLL